MRAKQTAGLCLLLALLTAGCGGSAGDSPPAGTSPSSGAAATTGRQGAAATRGQSGAEQSRGEGEAKEQGEGGQGEGRGKSRSAIVDPPLASKRTPGSKAVAPGVPVTKGGDNSVQAFGVEGEEDQAAQAYDNLRSYLAALGAGEFAEACALASSQFRDELEKLVEQAKVPEGQERPEGCAGTLKALLGGASAAALAPLTRVGELLSFRVRPDGYAYLIFRGAQGKAMFVAMAEEGGKWRVNVLKPEAFSTGQGEGSAQ